MSNKFHNQVVAPRDSSIGNEYNYATTPRSHQIREALTVLTLVALFAASSVTQAFAQQEKGPNPMDGVAEALNLTPEQLRGCLGEPPAPGARPSDSDHAALIQCLIGQNASLTAGQIDAAMEAMRDARPRP